MGPWLISGRRNPDFLLWKDSRKTGRGAKRFLSGWEVRAAPFALASVTLRVKVIPRAARSEIAGTMADGTLRARIAAAPEKGRANEELRELLAGHFGVAKSEIEIISGHTSALKLVRVGRG